MKQPPELPPLDPPEDDPLAEPPPLPPALVEPPLVEPTPADAPTAAAMALTPFEVAPWLAVLTAFALGGVLGGTIGNLYDRIVHHAVRDHLELTIRIPAFDWNYHWPIFNVADAFICTGAILFALCVMFGKKGKETAPGLAGAPAAPQA